MSSAYVRPGVRLLPVKGCLTNVDGLLLHIVRLLPHNSAHDHSCTPSCVVLTMSALLI